MSASPNHRPAPLALPTANVRGWKRRKLIFRANKYEDRQWKDYREAVYPLLLKFGCFDPLPKAGVGIAALQEETHAALMALLSP